MGKIEELKAQREAIDKQIKALENGRWKPAVGERYYTIAPFFYIGAVKVTWSNDERDQLFYSIGQVFRTEEERDAYVNRLKAVTKYNDYIRSTGFVADFSRGGDKFYPIYDIGLKQWECTYFRYKKLTTDILPAASREDVMAAIASLGDDERWLR